MLVGCGTFLQHRLNYLIFKLGAKLTCVIPKFFFNAQDLIVFCQSFRPTRSSRFNLNIWINKQGTTCPVASPTTRSAIKVSSVSPERWDTITPQSFSRDNLAAWIDSVTLPIWLTFKSKQLHDFRSIAIWIRLGFVTVKSSPINWMDVEAYYGVTKKTLHTLKALQVFQSSWSNPSSIETMGYSAINDR